MAYTPLCMHMALLQALSILLLASMLVPGPGSAEEAPSAYRIELIHVDANGGFTREELISRAVERTDLRAAMLSDTHGTNSPASSGTYKFAVQSSSHEYLMELKMGTPPEPFWAVADTGSDLVWTKQLKLCASSTFTHGSCSDSPPNCKSCSTGEMCSTCFDEELCMFRKKYGSEKRTAKGFMGWQILTLPTDVKVSIAFGCAINWTKKTLPKSADGIVGLNLGPMSLVKQLGVTKFSYCLNNQLTPQLSSPLWLGDAGGESGSSLKTTKLAEIRKDPQKSSVMNNRYYVELDGICINDKENDKKNDKENDKKNDKEDDKKNDNCRSLEENKIKLKSINDKGVMMVDSGTPHTLLDKTVFSMLKELLLKELSKGVPGVELRTEKITTSTGKEKILTCFELPASHSKPDMVLRFTDEAEMRLPWANYMDDAADCLTIHEAKEDSEISKQGILGILGNFQQQNKHMFYDLTERKLSFVEENCITGRTN